MIMGWGSRSGEASPHGRRQAGPEWEGPCLHGDKAQAGSQPCGQHFSTHHFSRPGSEQQAKGNRWCLKQSLSHSPTAQVPSCSLTVFWAGWERQQAGQAGWAAPSTPSSGMVHTHAHAHTRPTLACTTSPCLREKAGSPSPQLLPKPSREGTPMGGSVQPPSPWPSWPLPWAAKSHDTPLLAPLPAIRTLGEGAQAREEGRLRGQRRVGVRFQGPELPRRDGVT